MAAAVQQWNVRLQQQETMATFLQAERDDFARQVQSATSTIAQRQPGVDTRVIGRPDKFDGDPMKYVDWLFKLVSHLGAMDQWYQLEPTTTEASSTPRINAALSEASCLSTQMYHILVVTTTGSALNECHNAGENDRIRGLETVRDGMGAKTCWTPDERVVLQTQKTTYRQS